MEFSYHLNNAFPKLAWGGVILKNSTTIDIYHGTGIETRSNYFVEGAWNGEFEKGNFDESTFFMGSGCKKINKGAGVLFATSSHTQERLYTIKDEDIIYISNSLPLILYMSDNKLKSDYLDYESDFNSILKGINKFKKYIDLEENIKLRLHYYCNFYVDNNFNIIEEDKTESRDFINYKDYYNSLIEDLKLFIKNARSQPRKIKYGLVATISKGYDAAACAAVAFELGCDKVVTFNEPLKYAEDSGKEIAINLGYTKVITKNAHEYLLNHNNIEAEFVSSGELGTGIVFCAFEDEFENNIVFIGERGDKIWDKNRTDANDLFRFDNEVYSGTSLIENRLKVGYIMMPMPLYKADSWISINKISNSNEMKNYSIGGNYDRPIPRRILETKGINRNEFGVEKKGAGFNYRFDNLDRLKKRMSINSYNSFLEFYKNNKVSRMDSLQSWIRYLWDSKSVYLNYFLLNLGIKYKSKSLTATSYSNPGAPAYLFKWGNHIMVKRYENSKIIRWWLEEKEKLNDGKSM